jgi:[lysine-biosynthesis-protein LysW]--L-2-aminoadipate ligase
MVTEAERSADRAARSGGPRPGRATVRVAVIGSGTSTTNRLLVADWRARGIPAQLLDARAAREALRPGDVAIGRIDVARKLDGVEPGLLDLLLLERAGVDVRNRAFALLRVHDKLRTAAALSAAGIPHPRTGVVRSPEAALPVAPPLVVKPRFGSWGRDVYRCSSERAARLLLRSLAGRSWFRRHGALVQELVPAGRQDVRAVVADRDVVGACVRTAAPGDWRTNVSLGGSRTPFVPGPELCRLAVRAARALGADLVGVDLLPLPGGGLAVLELNGAVDFDELYSLPGRNVCAASASALGLLPS